MLSRLANVVINVINDPLAPESHGNMPVLNLEGTNYLILQKPKKSPELL